MVWRLIALGYGILYNLWIKKSSMSQIQKLVEKIITKKRPTFFISPHLDDAIFSAGGLMSKLAGKTDVTLVTVFTQADNSPYTFSTKRNLRLNKMSNAQDLYAIRRAEDIKVCQKLKISYIHLPFKEASYRKKSNSSKVTEFLAKVLPEVVSVYPLYRNFFKSGIISGNISKEDNKMMIKLKKELKKIVFTKKNPLIFCPQGVGNHVDHLVVRDVCEDLFKDLVYWIDFPYYAQADAKNSFQVPKSWSLIKLYKSQIKNVSSDKKTLKSDIFIPKS